MHTFYQFIHKLTTDTNELHNYSTINYDEIKFAQIAWSSEYNSNSKIPIEQDQSIRLLKIIFHMMFMNKKKYSVQNKFSFFKKTITNPYISDLSKEIFVNKFREIQRHYCVLNRAVRNYKFKRAPFRMNSDLILNTINESQHNVITILSNGNKYLFTVLDLKNIIESALTNSPYFFSNPLPPKNPYNNLPFDKSTLYNIYFFMKQGNFVLSTLFHNYFLCNFNLNQFRQENEVSIRKNYIQQYIKNLDYHDLYDDAIEMIKRNKYTRRLNIDKQFPKRELAEIMKPYLKIYYNCYYSLCVNERNVSFRILNEKLRKFYIYNPKFGRRYVNMENNNKIEFNNLCTEFVNKKYFNNFQNSHLTADIDDDSVDNDVPLTYTEIRAPPFIINYNLSEEEDRSESDSDGSEGSEGE